MLKYNLAKEPSLGVKENLKNYDALTQKLLFNRGITEKIKAQKFLNPDYIRDIYNPFLILGMEKAVERILRAIKNEEKIIIYGDYDADGIPGSVVLHDFFKKIGYKNFENYIPHRYEEGYGLNIPAIEKFAKDKVKLLITVDCGITDVAQVNRANELEIDVIITDHHLPGKNLPKAYTILNSKQEKDYYPDGMLCGAGVAFKLVQGLIQKGGFNLKEGWEKWLLDMVGISTLSDMVPLVNENRALAYFGLKVLRKSRRLGLKTLLRKIKVNQENISEGDIGFMVSPRINAASRLDVPMRAFELLSTDDEVIAEELANHLNKINDQRKGVVSALVKEAKKILKERDFGEIIVIGNPKWKPGVLGLVANSLVEEYERPVFVWGRDTSTCIKGSCRSDGSINVVTLMSEVEKDIFLDTGGHDMAGGFSISHEKIHLLEEKLLEASNHTPKLEQQKTLLIDNTLTLEEITWETYSKIEKLAPFGVANHQPIFLLENIEIHDFGQFGKVGNHLKINFRDKTGRLISTIGFFMDAQKFDMELSRGQKINLVANLEKSVFRGFPELRLRIIDISSV